MQLKYEAIVDIPKELNLDQRLNQLATYFPDSQSQLFVSYVGQLYYTYKVKHYLSDFSSQLAEKLNQSDQSLVDAIHHERTQAIPELFKHWAQYLGYSFTKAWLHQVKEYLDQYSDMEWCQLYLNHDLDSYLAKFPLPVEKPIEYSIYRTIVDLDSAKLLETFMKLNLNLEVHTDLLDEHVGDIDINVPQLKSMKMIVNLYQTCYQKSQAFNDGDWFQKKGYYLNPVALLQLFEENCLHGHHFDGFKDLGIAETDFNMETLEALRPLYDKQKIFTQNHDLFLDNVGAFVVNGKLILVVNNLKSLDGFDNRRLDLVLPQGYQEIAPNIGQRLTAKLLGLPAKPNQKLQFDNMKLIDFLTYLHV